MLQCQLKIFIFFFSYNSLSLHDSVLDTSCAKSTISRPKSWDQLRYRGGALQDSYGYL